jgi:membrane protease YdiL (CAAX protease family)
VFAVAQILLAIPYVMLATKESEGPAATAVASSLGSDGFFLGLAEVCCGGVALALTLLIAGLRKGPSVRDYLGFKAVPVSTILLWLLVTIVVGILLEIAVRAAGYPTTPEWMMKIYRSARSFPLLLVALFVVAPVFEETLFRGFLFAGLRRSRLGSAGAVFVASLAWTSVHIQYELIDLACLFCLGLLLGAARARTGSLIPPVAMHSLFSAVAMLQLVLESR